MKHVESRLQIACVAWFRAQYASIWNLLFSVPNGGARSKTEGAILKAEGATRGVADLLLLVARGGFGALAIEMKTTSKKSDQSEQQIEWETAATQAGNKYVVVRTLEEFQQTVNAYLSQPPTNPERQNPHLFRVPVSGRMELDEFLRNNPSSNKQ